MGNCWIPLSGLNDVLLEGDSSAVVRWMPKKVASREDARWNGFMFQAAAGVTFYDICVRSDGDMALWLSAFVFPRGEGRVVVTYRCL